MRKETHSGIYLLPNLMTTMSLFAAFYSIVASLNAQYETAVIAIFIGFFTDGLDGRIARLTNTQTAFGAEYDSLADMVTFGLAPALLLYTKCLHQFGKLGWLLAFVYTAAVALRLARFNTQVATEAKNYFQGLPCPSAAALLSSFVWLSARQEWPGTIVGIVLAIICFIVSILMVSNIRYYSAKQLDFKGKVPFLYIIILILLFVAIASDPPLVIFLVFLIYVSSGPTQTLIGMQKRRNKRRHLLARRKLGK